MAKQKNKEEGDDVNNKNGETAEVMRRIRREEREAGHRKNG